MKAGTYVGVGAHACAGMHVEAKVQLRVSSSETPPSISF